MCQVSWSLEVKHPRTSMTFERFALKWLCVYACSVEFYVFVLDENHVVGPKLVCEHIWVGNVRVRLHIGPTRGSKGGPQLGAQHCQVVPNEDPNDGQSTRQRPINGWRRWSLKDWMLRSSRSKPRDPIDGVWSHPRTVNGRASMVLWNCLHFSVKT